jgi:hypothetical protein
VTFLLGVPGTRLAELVSREAKFQAVTGEVFDRGYFFQQLLQSVLLKPLEGVQLYLDQVRYVQDFG